MNAIPSQSRRILRRLAAAKGRWVSLPDLWRASGSMAVHSRVAELRRQGHRITNRTEQRGRRRASAYRIEVGA